MMDRSWLRVRWEGEDAMWDGEDNAWAGEAGDEGEYGISLDGQIGEDGEDDGQAMAPGERGLQSSPASVWSLCAQCVPCDAMCVRVHLYQ